MKRYLAMTMLVLLAVAPTANSQARSSRTDQNAQTKGSEKSMVAHSTQAAHGDDGQRIFDQNCSRCHAAPDGFSPHISGTVTRHMRVRANLSKKDEQELLRFLNP
jgi:cytochrome c5